MAANGVGAAMASETMENFLVGFSSDLDWRPLSFVRPIPQYWTCDACGLVHKRAALLSCKHMLCENCHNHSAQDEARFYPKDGIQSEQRDVEMRKLNSAEQLSREVKCWNRGSGCGAVLPASKIAQHFQTECGHHSVNCRKCSAIVLYNDVCAHLRSEYCTSATSLPSECGGYTSRKDQRALVTSETQALKRPGIDVKTNPHIRLFDRSKDIHQTGEIVYRVEKYQDPLRQELDRGINSVKETIRREVAQKTREQRDSQKECLIAITSLSDETALRTIANGVAMDTLSNSVKRLEIILDNKQAKMAGEQLEMFSQTTGCNKDVTKELKECKNMLNQVGKIFRNTNVHGSCYDFFLKGVKSLREEALRKGFAVYQGDKIYLLGYYLSPGVYLQKQSETVTLHARIRVNMGDMDDVVHWPFTKTVKLRVLHPTRWAELEINETISGRVSGSERPDESSTAAVYTTSSLNLDDLINDGYAERDELRVEFELLP